VQRIAGYGKPVALLDESGDAPPVHPADTAALTGHFCLPYGKDAGLSIGAYLRGLGHRNVAYISHLHRNAWSQERLDGLSATIGAPGAHGRVAPFVLDDFAWPEDHIRKARGILDGVKGHLSIPDETGNAVLSHTLSTISGQLESVLIRESLRAALRPLFQAAIADPSLTAWVGANDEVALEARAFLEEQGRRVPEDVSVVGMDDSTEASVHHLTSYSFNGRAAMRAMVAYVLSPARAPHGSARSPLEIGGAVVARRTCGARK
jgi:DNA-binding LacI/PurR family transcriptional regulator